MSPRVSLFDPLDQFLTLRQDAGSSKQQHARLGVAAPGDWAEFGSTASVPAGGD
jgi:hypothetical protein